MGEASQATFMRSLGHSQQHSTKPDGQCEALGCKDAQASRAGRWGPLGHGGWGVEGQGHRSPSQNAGGEELIPCICEGCSPALPRPTNLWAGEFDGLRVRPGFECQVKSNLSTIGCGIQAKVKTTESDFKSLGNTPRSVIAESYTSFILAFQGAT